MAFSPKLTSAREFGKLEDVEHGTSPYRANLHGVIEVMSDVKTSQDGRRKYFDGILSDDNAKIRFVCFVPARRSDIAKLGKDGKPVSFSNCQIKENRNGGMEVILIANANVMRSPRKIKATCRLAELSSESSKTTDLGQLESMPGYQKVSVRAKVVDAAETVTLSSGAKVRKIGLGDASGSTTLSLWGELVDAVTVGKSYAFEGFMIKQSTFDDSRCLTTHKQGASINMIDDLNAVQSLPFSLSEKPSVLSNAIVTGVSNLVCDVMCPTCQKGSLSAMADNTTIGNCSACSTRALMASSTMKHSALLTINSEGFIIKLKTDGGVMSQICETPESSVTDVSLLTARPFTISYNKWLKAISADRQLGQRRTANTEHQTPVRKPFLSPDDSTVDATFPQKTVSRMLDFGHQRGTGSSLVLSATKSTDDRQDQDLFSAEDIALLSESKDENI